MSRPSRTLSRSGLSLPELGLGCATLSFDPAPDAITEACAMLQDAVAQGIAYFDTAPLYGEGLSERLTGDALRGTSGVYLSSKVGRMLCPDDRGSGYMPFRVTFDYTRAGILRSFEDSLQRLGLAHIDILFVHDLGQRTHGDRADAQLTTFFDGGGYRALEELRDAGVIGAFGLGVNEIEICRAAMARGDFDLFLLAGRHTLLERTEALPFLEDCAKANTDIVIGGPFNSGLLVGGATYDYRAIPDEIAARRRVLLDYCTRHGVEIGAAALQFPLRHPVVKSVIPGPRTRAELRQIIAWSEAQIPTAFWEGLAQLDAEDSEDACARRNTREDKG